MVFTTQLFLFYFLPTVLLIYYLIPQLAGRSGLKDESITRARNAFLLLASCVFYGWWNPKYVWLMLLATSGNYFCGLALARPGASERQRWWYVAAAVVLSLGVLGFFKYFNFFQANANALIGFAGGTPFQPIQVLLPIGISFYIFHSLSYTIDVYRRTAPPARSLTDFSCYIALYPQLVAGPIIRYNTVAGQLVNRSHNLGKFSSGVALFILGFAKKVLIANPIGEAADAAFGAESLCAIDAWFGVVAYALQIYFDFCGYSDMAVGLGRMVGFEFMKNFDSPYQSESITEFWRRWHISLSSFLRDYLYIPLGGNRKGEARTYANLAIVMLLGGLWHGANWTFVAWGAYQGAWLMFERWLGKDSLYRRAPRVVRIGITFVLVLFSWVLFRSDTLAHAMNYFGFMFGLGVHGPGATLVAAQLYTPGKLLVAAIAVLLLVIPIQAHHWSEEITWPKALAVAPAFCLALVAMFSQAYNPFLYFQF